MARAVTTDGRTLLYGPGDRPAGAFDHAAPLDADPASVREAAEDDAQLRDGWVRTLHHHEAAIQAALDAGDPDTADRLTAAVERTAYTQVQLATLDGIIDRVLVAGGVRPSERNRAFLRRLLLGGRSERTWRNWRSGRVLVPEDAAEALSRLRHAEIVASDEPEGPGQRLRVEYVIEP